jgi:MFS family permease
MGTRPWIAALSATLLMQTVGTFLSQIVPVVAPLMTAEVGLPPEAIGNLSSLNTLGAILFLLLGTPLVLRFGPLRMLQAGAVLGAAAMALGATGSLPLVLAASLLLGVGYGPTGPAGSRLLQATAPPRHRVLIFSVKQAGAPAGGALAGIVAAPLAAALGWQAAVLAGGAVALLAAVAIEPLRSALDAERDPRRNLREALTLRGLSAPLATLGLHPALPPLVALAFAFAVLQGVVFAFTVTWLVEVQGLALTAAGTAFAVMQLAGVAGRLLLGWVADRTGQVTRNLVVHALAAAIAAALWVLLAPGASWPVLLALAALAGFTSASWNGIFIAEVARLSPPDRVAEASAGAILLCFLGYLVAPSLFAALVTATGAWTPAFLLAAAVLALVALGVATRLRGRAA